MPGIALLDPTKTGRHAEDLENKFRHLVVGQDDSAREFLLVEGTDFNYGARQLKRAIERLLVQPLSNLMASGQIRRGDCIRVSHEGGAPALLFGRELEDVQAWGVAGRAV